MSLRLRAAAYSPNGARLGILPTPQGLQGSMVLGDVGAFSISYPLNGPKAPFLSGACEVALEVSYDDGQTWTEPNDARYLRLRRKGDQVDAPDVVSYEGPSYLWLLDKSPILPEGALDNQGKRPFLAATVGTIMRTVVAEAQARGELPGLDVATFSAATDSNGAAWGSNITIYYEPGVSALTILRNLFDQGMCDFTMVGRSLRIYKAGTVMAGASGATLLKGRDLTEAPYQATLEGIASHAYLLGDGGLSFERANPTAPQPWGRWTTFISQGGVSDTGTMTVLTDATLALAAQERVENTYGLDFSRAKALPFRDYTLGKTVAVSAAGAVPEALRLRQVTLTRDEKGTVQGNVVLNDRFLENEVRQSRRIAGITGGSTADGGTGSRPDDGVDRTTPKAPTGLTWGSVAYMDDEGRTWAAVTVDWGDVTQNTDNTAITDLAGYEVQWAFQGSGAWVALPPTDTTSSLTASGFQPNTAYDFRVRAFDNGDGRLVHRSAWSATVTNTTAQDATAPGKPAAATVTAYLGQLLIDWSGLLDAGGPQALDFDRAEIHLSSVNGFIPSAATLLDTITSSVGGSTVATGLAYDTPYYVKVVTYDRAGNASPASDQSTGTPVRIVSADVGLNAVARANLVTDVRTSLGQLVVDDFTTNEWGAPVSGATPVITPKADAATGTSVAVGTNYVQWYGQQRWTFDPSQLYRVTFRVRKTVADTNATVLYAGVKTYDATGATVGTNGGNLYMAATAQTLAVGTAWVEYVGYLTGGGGAANVLSATPSNPETPSRAIDTTRLIGPLLLLNYSAAGGGQVTEVDSYRVEAVPTGLVQTVNIGTAAVSTAKIADLAVISAKIADLAVGTAKIADLAVNSAKIANVTADKITAGVMSAAVTISGRIATALTGARVEINSTGLKAYNSGGVNTVAINTDGSATVSGTYQTAPSGRRLEISTAALNNNFGEDGQHSLKWTPTTLSAGWSQAGIMPVVDTSVTGKTGLALWLQSSNQPATPFGGSTIFLGMTSASINLTSQSNSNASLSVSSNAAGVTSADVSATNTTIGQGGSGTVAINGGTSISLFSSAGSVFVTAAGGNTIIYERDQVGEALAARNDGNPYLRSQSAYNRTSTAAVNMTISSFGTIARSTSLERYKVAIDREWADKVSLSAVKGLTPASYYDRQQAERFASWLDPGSDVPDENVELPRLNLGLIAEDVEALGLLGLTNYDDQGNLTGVAYERVAVALIPWLRDLERRLEAQERRQEPVGSTA